MTETEAKLPLRQATTVNLPAGDRRALASLGYVAHHSGDGNDPALQSLPDIKDRIGFHYRIEEANRLLDQNHTDEALVELRAIVEAAPEAFMARMFLGEALAKSGKLEEALHVFQEVAKDEDAQSEVHARIGWILGQQGHSDKAIAELRRALELAPESPEYRVRLGVLFLELKHPEEAQEMFQSAVQIDPVNGNFELARELATAGDIEGAIQHLKLTLKFDPNWSPLYAEISLLLARQRQFDEAVAYASRAVQLSPQSADLHYNLGVMSAQQGRIDQAIESLQEALRLDPRHPQAAVQLQRVEAALQNGHGQRQP
jgi:tetratricopeptide (TPR) repeat protein